MTAKMRMLSTKKIMKAAETLMIKPTLYGNPISKNISRRGKDHKAIN